MSKILNAKQLKWIALITMTVDHIGAFILPQYISLRLIGRVAFPIYAFLIAEGYVHTSNKRNYFLRILGFALVTQALFAFFDVGFVNVLFTFAIGIAGMYWLDKKNYIVLLLLMVITVMLNPDYTYYGVGMILLYHLFRSSRKTQFVTASLATLVFTCQPLLARPELVEVVLNHFSIYWTFFAQMFSVLCIPFLMLYNGEPGKKPSSRWGRLVTKYFFYVYYPLHILVFVWIGRMV